MTSFNCKKIRKGSDCVSRSPKCEELGHSTLFSYKRAKSLTRSLSLFSQTISPVGIILVSSCCTIIKIYISLRTLYYVEKRCLNLPFVICKVDIILLSIIWHKSYTCFVLESLNNFVKVCCDVTCKK